MSSKSVVNRRMGEHDSVLYSIGRRGAGELLHFAAAGCAADKPWRLKVNKTCRRERRFATGPVIIGFCLFFSACASVDTILLTSESFPPKGSAEEVAVLERTPTRPHRDLAELRIGDSWLSFGSLQHKILNRAAALGADAVVFAQPQTQTTHRVAYEPLYGPWGYGSPYYAGPWGYGMYGGLYGGWGPWGGFSSGSIAVPYDETVRILMGTAIRYSDEADLQSGIASGEPGAQTITSEKGGQGWFSP